MRYVVLVVASSTPLIFCAAGAWISERCDDYGFRLRKQSARVVSVVAREVGHLAVQAFGKPFAQRLSAALQSRRGREGYRREAQP